LRFRRTRGSIFRRVLRHALATLTAILVVGLVACGGEDGARRDSGAGSNARSRSGSSLTMARMLARRVARPWPKLQDFEGRYAGNVRGFTRYGEAVLGYGLIDVGQREGDKRWWPAA